MKYSETIALYSDSPIDREKLLQVERYLNERNIEVRLTDIGYSLSEVQDMLQREGPTYIMSLRVLREEILPVTNRKDASSFGLLIDTLLNKLIQLSPSESLTIVDGYLFATNIKNQAEYLTLFEKIINSVIGKIKLVRFVTLPSYNDELYKKTVTLLENMNPHISVEHSKSEYFHDRFWIADDQRGIFVGTSLNGLGNKYALVDNIRDSDTNSIVGELRRLELI
jgi:hypothetical protein